MKRVARTGLTRDSKDTLLTWTEACGIYLQNADALYSTKNEINYALVERVLQD